MRFIESFDQAVWNHLDVMRGRDIAALTPVFRGLSWVASPAGVTMLALLGVLALWAKGRGRPAVGLLLAVGGALALAFGAKAVVARERPDPKFRTYELPASKCFPSDHAMSAAALFGYAAILVARGGGLRGRLSWLTALVALPIIAIGFSQMVLGLSYLSDVAVGWLAGGAWAWACVTWAARPAAA